MATTMMDRVLVVTLAMGLVAASPIAQQTTPPPQVFRSTADTVPLFVTVLDKTGRLATNLERGDFQVFDNGKPQTLTVYQNSPQPIRLIVLMDVSGSMAGAAPLMGRACSELIARLTPGDLARVGIFGREIAISPVFTRDAQALADWLPDVLPPNAPTPLWNAVDQAIGEFAGLKDDARRVVLVMSDAKDSGPLKFGQKFLSPIEIIDRALAEDVMVYGVGVRSSLSPSSGGGMGNLNSMLASTLPDPGLGTVAVDTGGGYFELRTRDDLAATFARVADELHQQYLLAFTPPARDGKVHKIEVRLRQDGFKARVRKSYRAPK